MNDIKKNKTQSPLVQSVLNLDGHFADLERLSARIEEIELKSEFDFTQARQLLGRFAECAQSVSTEIVDLVGFINEARIRAETAGKIVAAKAEQLQELQDKQDDKMKAFHVLAEKVATLNENLKSLKKPNGEELSESERILLVNKFGELKLQLEPLIEEAVAIKNEARTSKMKVLEQNADSLSQSLTAVKQKLTAFQPTLQ